MRSNCRVWSCCWSLLILLAVAEAASAALVRGKLERTDPRGSRLPAGGITVTVRFQNSRRSAPATSRQDGMYYIYNVPAGTCYLELWIGGTRSQPTTYPIQVREPYTDVPPIKLP